MNDCPIIFTDDAWISSGLERLCRYVLHPPLAGGRLRLIDADHLTFRLKTPWSDGTTHLVLSPLELIEKLAALVPPPRPNRVLITVSWRPMPLVVAWSCRVGLCPRARHRGGIFPFPRVAVGWVGRLYWRVFSLSM